MGDKLIYEALGRQISTRRQELEKSQDQLAREIGISRASLANIELGRQNVYVHQIVQIARALGMSSARELVPDGHVEVGRKRIGIRIESGDRLSVSQKKQVDAAVAESDRKAIGL